MANPALTNALPKIVSIFQQNIDTNLTTEEMLTLVHFIVHRKSPHLKMLLLPVKFSDGTNSINSN